MINVKDSELDSFICSDCTGKLRLDYNEFVDRLKEAWAGDFEDLLAVYIDERLKKLRLMYPELCKSKLNIKQIEVIDRKLGTMYDNFVESEDARIEAKIESAEISLEDLAAI